MSDRYRIEFTEGGVDAFETVITGGLAKVVEKGLDTISGDDNHGWNCTITDKETGVKVCQWGVSKAEAQEKTFQALKIELENYKAEQMAKKEATEYRSRREHQNTHQATSNDEDVNSWIGKIIGFCLVAAAIIWFVFSVAVPLILINIALISLITGLVKKNWNKYLYSISIIGSGIVIFDYYNGWSTKTLVKNVPFFADLIPAFFYINVTAGLVAAYFLIRNYLNEKKPLVENEAEFSKRNLIIIGCLSLVALILFLVPILYNTVQNPFNQNAFNFNSDSNKDSNSKPSNTKSVSSVYISMTKKFEGYVGKKSAIYILNWYSDGSII